eukprot:5451725-Prymnesium_polylepis.1
MDAALLYTAPARPAATVASEGEAPSWRQTEASRWCVCGDRPRFFLHRNLVNSSSIHRRPFPVTYSQAGGACHTRRKNEPVRKKGG